MTDETKKPEEVLRAFLLLPQVCGVPGAGEARRALEAMAARAVVLDAAHLARTAERNALRSRVEQLRTALRCFDPTPDGIRMPAAAEVRDVVLPALEAAS